jgi:hypothetical protein
MQNRGRDDRNIEHIQNRGREDVHIEHRPEGGTYIQNREGRTYIQNINRTEGGGQTNRT